MQSIRDILTRRPTPLNPPEKVEVTNLSNKRKSDETLQPASKKIKKYEKKPKEKKGEKLTLHNTDKFILKGWSNVTVVPPDPTDRVKERSKYKILVYYQEKGKKTIRSKPVLFGRPHEINYIDDHDEERRLKYLKNVKTDLDNWLHPNFYRTILLNSIYDTVDEAWQEMVKAYKFDVTTLREQATAERLKLLSEIETKKKDYKDMEIENDNKENIADGTTEEEEGDCIVDKKPVKMVAIKV